MTLVPSLCFLPGYFQTSVVNEQQYNNTQTGAHEHRSQNPVVCRKTVERISWRVRYFFLESPVFLPGESGISSWRVRRFFLESPVFFASAHFCVRRDGLIVQLVWEHNRAWHARSSGMYYFGIEHEGDRASGPSRSFGRRRVTPSVCARMISCCASFPGSWPIYARNTASKLCIQATGLPSLKRTVIVTREKIRIELAEIPLLRTRVNAATPRSRATRIAPTVEEIVRWIAQRYHCEAPCCLVWHHP